MLSVEKFGVKASRQPSPSKSPSATEVTLPPAQKLLGSANVQILDPSVHICTLSEEGKISMEMRLKQGRGYVSADRNFDESLFDRRAVLSWQ